MNRSCLDWGTGQMSTDIPLDKHVSLSGRKAMRSDNFKSGVGGGTGRGSSWYSFHIVWQKDNEIRQLQKPSDDLVNHDTAT